MSHIFQLQPDLEVLRKEGYIDKSQAKIISANGSLQVEIDAVWNEDQRKHIEQEFKTLARRFKLTRYLDTLLFICLVESNNADQQYQYRFQAYEQLKRDKEIAQFMLINKHGNKHKPNNIKITGVMDSVKLTDPSLIDWLGKLVKEAIEKQEFDLSVFGQSWLRFVANDDGEVGTEPFSINYTYVEQVANTKMRKPGIRERNRYLALFLSNVLSYLNTYTPLSKLGDKGYTDDQVKFLFEVACIVEWLNELDFDSEPKDYMYALLSNHLR